MTDSLQILTLEECSLDEWRALDAWAPADERHRQHVDDLLERRDELDERTFLLAYDGDRVVGRLVGRFLDLITWSIVELTTVDEDSADVDAALLGSLAESFNIERVRIIVTDRDRDRRKREALESAGYSITLSKSLFRRGLADYRMPYTDPLRYRTLDEVPRELFQEVLEAAHIGDPLEESAADDRSALETYISLAGQAYESRRWRIAELDGVPVGVILPQPYPDMPTLGTLFHIGVLPEFRGRGLGRILHAKGLELLSGEVDTYVGSTHVLNAPMIRVFERNGCEFTTTQHMYTP
jgi:RimJ/RimL family protein N-acetyltransferase